MSTAVERMRITIIDRGMRLRDRLRERLDQAAALLCPEHGQAVIAVTIHGRENGWFDSSWVTCCANLEREALAIVRDRC